MSSHAISGSAAQPLDLSSLPDVAALTPQQAHLIERAAETWLLEHPAVEDAAVVVTGFTRDERVTKCARCGIASVFPGVDFDEQLVCSLCRDYEANRDQILRYFGQPDAFGEMIRTRAAEADSEFDCLLLYSGGKDSTYVLFQLLELGLKVMTYTFDNGFISKTALRNVEEITRELGVTHVTLTRADQQKIFLESLHEHKSVCNGCFRSLLEIGHQVAAEHGIPSIVTGLSRGQIIDERLSWFYRNGIYDPERIDAELDSGRRVYHLLHRGGEGYIGDRVKVIDFFRYSEVTKEDIRCFLAEHPSWSQPTDTGFCSSNCLINDAGVFVHKLERGYHNYEAPTRWEVRLGHLTKSVADEELVDPTVNRRITTLLDRIGYEQPETREILAARMIAYVVTDGTSIDAVRAWAEQTALSSVPRILPSRWVPLSSMPRIGGALEFRNLPRISDSRFDAVPMEPEATPTPVGFLEPTRALALSGTDRPRARAVALDIPWGIVAGRIAVAVAAAASEVPAARLQWTASEPPTFERVPAGRAWVKRLDLTRSSSDEWPQQVRTLTARLLARHDPHAGCLQAFMLDGPKGARVLVLTADESGLGPNGLAPMVAAIGRILGIWESPPSAAAAHAREEAIRWLHARDCGARIRVSGGGTVAATEGDVSEHRAADLTDAHWTTELVIYDGAGVPGVAVPYRELDARLRRFAAPVRPDGAPASSIVIEPTADGWCLVPESGEAVEMPVPAGERQMRDTDLRARWRELSPERQLALLASRRKRHAAAIETTEVSSETSMRGPLTPSQARMHFLQTLAPDSAIYHMSALVRVRGDLDLDRLIAALPAVAARQGALRTRIVEQDGVLHQEMLPDIEPDVVTHRIVASAQGQDSGWSTLLQRRSVQPFVLDLAPLWRVTIGIRSAGDIEILLTMHHIISDDWSMRVLFEDWVAAYTGIAASAAPMPYLAWATQQQDEVGSARAAAKREYWQRLLGTGSPALDLATDAPRPPVQRGRGALWRTELDADAVAGLRRLAASRRASLFTVLLAGWSALLSRQGTEQRIVVGVPIARRERAEHERVIGLFVDTLPVVVDVEQDIELGALVDQARDAFHGAVDNVLSLEEIILAVQPPRTRERAPVFQTMLTLHDVPPSSLGVPGLTFSPSSEELPHDTSMYDISLDVAPTLDGLELVVEYDTDLFTADHVSRIGEQLRLVLHQFAENPAMSVGRLDLGVGVPPVQAPLHDGTMSIPDAVLRWGEDRPDVTALVCGGDRMSYADLERAVTALAHRLRCDGVETGNVVAVLVDRSVEVIVAMLGVMRAGGVYLPLDPAAPAERRRTILADSEAMHALADTEDRMRELRDVLPVAASVRPVRSDNPSQESVESLPVLSADAAAYLIYTSGSTGTPKGVLVPHRGLVSLSSWYADYYDTAHKGRHLTTSNHAFDASIGDYGRALLCGGTLVIATREECVDPAALHRLIVRERITCMETVPAVMRELSRWLRAADGNLHGLETLVVGSDAWYAREITEYRRLLRPGVPIVAAYGVTEASVDSTYYDGGDAPLHPDQTVPIGHRVGNSTVVILDEAMRPVPEGVVGELAIGGNGLAFGYWRRPRATAERFLPNPFAAGERLYATGDLARLVGGEIEFLGRRDRQLKIRGFRIEPDEVELVLHAHPDIVDAAVVVREEGSETAYLAAYVVLAQPDDDRTARSILAHLRERLPAYMVPSTLTVLEALPKTTSNKIDRGALPAPAATDTARRLEHHGDADWSAEEQRIREFWQDVLDVPVPHPEANLFDLGAHSLLIPRVLHRIEQEFGTRLPLPLVFEHPTVRAMATRLTVAAPTEEQAEDAPSTALIRADLASIVAPVAVTSVRSGTSRVLVTGGSGYLGSHLVSSLLTRTDAEIVCLVRADDDEGARRRLAAAMTASALPAPDARVKAIAGDISRPGLGLSANDEAALMDGTDVIVHAAAWVNLIFPFSALRGVNVLGTQEMVRLAAAHGARLHHVSTAGVADVERLGLAESRNGYLQSKWLAEQLVFRAWEQGVAGVVHRPDFLSGAVHSARCNHSDLIWAIVDAGIEAGVALDLSIPLPMAPVDLVADCIIDQVVGGSTRGLFDYSHPEPIDVGTLFSLVSDHGYPLRTAAPEEWLSRVQHVVAEGRAAAVLPHLPFLTDMISPEAESNPSGPPAASGIPPRRVPQDGYAALGVECPPIDAGLLSRYLDDLTATGFLPTSTHRRRTA